MFGPFVPGYLVVFCIAVLGIVIAQSIDPKPWHSLIVQLGRSYMLLLTIPALMFALIVTLRLMRKGRERPLRVLWRVFRKERYWLLRTVFVIYCLIPGLMAFGRLKVQIDNLVPFYADPVLAGIDQAIFQTDPWRITHAIFGPLGTLFLDRLYMLFFVIVAVSGIWIITSRNKEFQVRALFTQFTMYFLLGFVMATSLSSVGPVFYEQYFADDRFRPLITSLQETNAIYPLSAIFIADWLGSEASQGRFGSGISAMPSMHVAHTFLYFLMIRFRFGRTWPTWTMGLFLAFMWIASVHLAWHYAIDGLVSILCVAMLWRLSGKFTTGRFRMAEPVLAMRPEARRDPEWA